MVNKLFILCMLGLFLHRYGNHDVFKVEYWMNEDGKLDEKKDE